MIEILISLIPYIGFIVYKDKISKKNFPVFYAYHLISSMLILLSLVCFIAYMLIWTDVLHHIAYYLIYYYLINLL